MQGGEAPMENGNGEPWVHSRRSGLHRRRMNATNLPPLLRGTLYAGTVVWAALAGFTVWTPLGDAATGEALVREMAVAALPYIVVLVVALAGVAIRTTYLGVTRDAGAHYQPPFTAWRRRAA
jgi:hypothetical protein